MKFLAKIKYLVHNIPAPVKLAIETTIATGAAVFIATAKPLLPAVIGDPSMNVAKAAIATSATAALVAAYHAAKASVKTLAAKWAAIPVTTPEPPSQSTMTQA